MKKEHVGVANLFMSEAMHDCPHCKIAIPLLPSICCTACGALLPILTEKSDYCLLLLRHNPLAFNIDKDALDQCYFFYQQKTHPDFHQRNPHLAILHTQYINEAYAILKDPLLRAEFLLKQHSIFVGSEKDNATLPAALLMDILEKQETLEEATTIEVLSALEAQERQEKERLLTCISSDFMQQNWQSMAEHTLLLRYTTKYLKNILDKRRTFH